MKNKLVIVILISFFLLFAQFGVSAININSKTNENINKENLPPDKPIIIVPDKIPRGKWFKVEVDITDPNGDDLYIRFDAPIFPGLPSIWIGPITSPLNYKSWVNYRGPIGEYTIGVQAKDIFEAESEWTYIQFNITKSKTVNKNFQNPYQSFMEKFPFIIQLLDIII